MSNAGKKLVSAYSDTRILLTGGAGYIGSHLSQALSNQSLAHVVVDDLSTGLQDNLNPAVPFYQNDIADKAAIVRIIKEHDINTIIHLAASIKVDESIRDPLQYYNNNLINTVALLDALSATGKIKQFYFSSTAAIYGDQVNGLLAEDAACQPNSSYGWSKYFAEKIITDVCQQFSISYKLLRFFNVAGIDVEHGLSFTEGNSESVIRKACRSIVNQGMDFVIYGDDYPTPDGTCVRDFIHVQDLADIHLHLLKSNVERNMILNCGYGQGISIREIANKIKSLAPDAVRISVGARRPGDIYQAIANADRLIQEFHWQPQYNNLDAMIKETLQWELMHRGKE